MTSSAVPGSSNVPVTTDNADIDKPALTPQQRGALTKKLNREKKAAALALAAGAAVAEPAAAATSAVREARVRVPSQRALQAAAAGGFSAKSTKSGQQARSVKLIVNPPVQQLVPAQPAAALPAPVQQLDAVQQLVSNQPAVQPAAAPLAPIQQLPIPPAASDVQQLELAQQVISVQPAVQPATAPPAPIQRLDPVVAPPVQKLELAVAPPLGPVQLEPAQELQPAAAPPIQRLEPAVAPPAGHVQPEPGQQLEPATAPPVQKPEPAVAPPVGHVQPEPSQQPAPIQQLEPATAPPVQKPEPAVAPPGPVQPVTQSAPPASSKGAGKATAPTSMPLEPVPQDDADVFADTVSGSKNFKPGPLSAEDNAEFNEHVRAFEQYVMGFSNRTGKSLPYLWGKMSAMVKAAREQTLWNLYSHRWSLENERDEANGETPREFLKRRVAAYHAATDHLSDDEKEKMKDELADWAEKYEKEVADATIEKGELFKVMRRACDDFTETSRHLYTHYGLVAFGFVICTDSTDAAGVASNSCWANDPVVLKYLQKNNVHVRTLGGQVCNMVGMQRLAEQEQQDWSPNAYQVWKDCNQGERRDKFKDAMHHLQFVLRGEDAPNVMEYVKMEQCTFESDKCLVGWPPGVALPSVGRDKFRSAQMKTLNKALYRTFDAMQRGDVSSSSDSTLIRFVDLTEDQLKLREDVRTLGDWYEVPIWMQSDGTVILRVRDFIGAQKGKKIAQLREEARKKKGKEHAKPEPVDGAAAAAEDDDSDEDDADSDDGAAKSKKRQKRKKTYREVSDDDSVGGSGVESKPRAPAKRKKAAENAAAGKSVKKRKAQATSGGATSGGGKAKPNPVGGGGEHMMVDAESEDEQVMHADNNASSLSGALVPRGPPAGTIAPPTHSPADWQQSNSTYNVGYHGQATTTSAGGGGWDSPQVVGYGGPQQFAGTHQSLGGSGQQLPGLAQLFTGGTHQFAGVQPHLVGSSFAPDGGQQFLSGGGNGSAQQHFAGAAAQPFVGGMPLTGLGGGQSLGPQQQFGNAGTLSSGIQPQFGTGGMQPLSGHQPFGAGVQQFGGSAQQPGGGGSQQTDGGDMW